MNNKYLVHPPASLAPIIISAPPENDNGIDTPLTVPYDSDKFDET